MNHQTPKTEQNLKDSELEHPNEYSLDELLSKSPTGSFTLDSEGTQWLSGTIIESVDLSSD